MFADPLNLRVAGVVTPFNRVQSDKTTNTYRTSDGSYELRVSQYESKGRNRRELRISQTKVAPDPYTAINKDVSASFIITMDEPKYGFSDSDLISLALITWQMVENKWTDTELDSSVYLPELLAGNR